MNLYEISNAIREAIDAGVDIETGEITEDAAMQLDALDIALSDKLESIGCVIREMEVEAKTAKGEAARLTARQKAAENEANRLKNYALGAMIEINIPKIKSARVTLSVAMAPPSCVITDADAIPADYIHEETVIKVDKKAAIAHWKETNEMPDGMSIQQNPYLRLR